MAPQATVAIVVAGPRMLERRAVAAGLAEAPGFCVAGEAATADDTLAICRRLGPDVAVVDAGLRDRHGASACQLLKGVGQPGVLVLGADTDQRQLFSAVEDGADGFVAKSTSMDGLVDAVRAVHAGEAVVPPAMLGTLLRHLIERNRRAEQVRDLYAHLTRREKQVLELLAEGCDRETIAEVLVISQQTARTHVTNLLSKLGAHSQQEAAAMAVRYGLVPVGSTRRTG